MSSFIRLLMYFWVYCKGYIIVAFILCKVVSALYLKVTGYDKWWLGFIPFGHVYYKIELAGISPVLLLSYTAVFLLAIADFNIYMLFVAVLLDIVSNQKFANIYIDDVNPWVYACVPFMKYIIMLKEVIINARIKSR